MELKVKIYGEIVGYLAEDKNNNISFEYEDDFLKNDLEISPIKLKKSTTGIYHNSDDTYFGGLAGVFHDSLPDKFGNAIIEQYFADKGIERNELSLLQKLAYVGVNSMGALEYIPSEKTEEVKVALEIRELVDAARDVINGTAKHVIPELMESGASAGGARAKAIIAWNKKTGEIRSGREIVKKDFEHYIFKFDGTNDNRKAEEYTRIEYIYMKIAKTCGLNVSEVELFKEREYNHLAVKRFDRVGEKKVHMHSLCGITHIDFNKPGIFSYEDYLRTVQAITNSDEQIQLAIMHMIFNIISRNQDDHAKNFSFLMDEHGNWVNSPVYDLTYSNGSGYTSSHQLSLNGKRKNINRADILKVCELFGYKEEVIDMIIDVMVKTFSKRFVDYCAELNISDERRDKILREMNKLEK